MLNSKQRAYLIGLASSLEPIAHIGKNGVSPEAVQSVEEAFNTHELIKINVQKNSPDEPVVAADKLSARTHSENVKVIGRKFILYRPDSKKPKIELP